MRAHDVDTSLYEFSHGKLPRGTGSWAFEIGPRTQPREERPIFWHNGTYADAKKAAIAEAERQGAYRVAVLP